MNVEKQLSEFNNSFQCKGMALDPELEKDANLKLIQLLALAPPGARSKGGMEKSGKNYLAEVKVHSHFRSFSSQAAGMNPRTAVLRALERLEDQLYRWRWGTDDVNSSNVSNLPWARSG